MGGKAAEVVGGCAVGAILSGGGGADWFGM